MQKLLIMFFIIVFTGTAYSATYYVDVNSGNDSNSGSINLPWQTITRAKRSVGTVQSGDVVYIRAGNYLVSTIFFNSDDSGDSINGPITYKAYQNENVVIDFQGDSEGLDISGDYLIFDGLNFKNAGEVINIFGENITIKNGDISGSNRFAAIQIGDNTRLARNTIILNNIIHDNYYPAYKSHGIYASHASNLIIRGNEFYNADGNGIQLQSFYGTSYLTDAYIEGNKIHDHVASGIFIREQSCLGTVVTNINIINNLVWDNNQGISSCQPNVKIYNNTITQNSNVGIMILNKAELEIVNNNVYGNGTDIKFGGYDITLAFINITNNVVGTILSSHINISSILAQINSDNLMATNPLFVSTSSTDPNFLKLRLASDAVNAGADLSGEGITDDYSGNARPNLGSYDIGAIEYTVEPPRDLTAD